MQVYSKQLGREWEQEIGKEENEQKPEVGNRSSTCDFRKTIALHILYGWRNSPSFCCHRTSTSKCTPCLLPPASLQRGWDFPHFPQQEFLWRNCIFQFFCWIMVPEAAISSFISTCSSKALQIAKKMTILMQKNPHHACKTLFILSKAQNSSKPGFLCDHYSAFWYRVNIYTR